MTRTRLAGMTASLAGLLCLVVLLCMAVPAQSRATSQPKASTHRSRQATAAHAAKREFAPRIIGRANSFIVNGRIVALRGQRLGIETAGGARLEFELSEQTTLLEANELVSIGHCQLQLLAILDNQGFADRDGNEYQLARQPHQQRVVGF